MELVLATFVTGVMIDVGMALAAFFVGVGASMTYVRLASAKDSGPPNAGNDSQPETLLNDAERSDMAAQQLRDLAQNVALDVGAHNSLVGAISSQLGAIRDGGQQHSADNGAVVMEAIAKLLASNNKLQERLEDAERKINVQAEEIRTQHSEARTDSLTKLANRRAFDAAMEENLAKFRKTSRPFSTLILDVDHFKQFNDTHGHPAGDEVLRCVGRTLTRTVKAGDMACRYGGEEFAVVLSNTKLPEAQIACERIRRAIDGMAVQFDGKTLRVTASLGVAEIQRDEDAIRLVRRADAAVYASKKAGRNHSHVHNGEECQVVGPSQTPPIKAKPEQPPAESRVLTLPPGSTDASRLPDRAAFTDELRRRIAENQRFGSPLAVLYFQVRHFDQLQNDYGTAVGSLLVDSVAVFVRSTLRDMDLLAKFGEGELAVMLPGSTASAAKIVGQRIRTSISHCPIPLGAHSIRLTLDMGVAAAAPDDDETSLLRQSKESLEVTRAAVEAAERNAEFEADSVGEPVNA